jgi:hypothetical protein
MSFTQRVAISCQAIRHRRRQYFFLDSAAASCAACLPRLRSNDLCLSCGSPLRNHLRRLGAAQMGHAAAPPTAQAWAAARSPSCRPCGRSNGTPDLRSAHIAAFAERHSHHCAPACSSASRVARCDGVPRPCADFIAMVTSLPRHSAKVTGYVIAAVAAADDVLTASVGAGRLISSIFAMDPGRARRRLFVCSMACPIAGPTRKSCGASVC